MPTNCERLATSSTLEETTEDDMVVMTKGTDIMPKEDDDKRLTATQREIRDRNANLPKHVRRSIDRFRVSCGMVPLWGASVEQSSRRA